MEAVVLNNISKTYGKEKKVAVDDVSFSVNNAELFGLIGPDGAGKTSIFRILTTLLLPDNGTATVNGLDVVKDFKAIRNTVGYMPGKFSLYQDLTVEENLRFFATIFNTSVAENYHLIKDIYVQLEPFKKRRAGKLSGGMKQKLALCCALIHKPTLLFLDEPTTGVDPVSRKEFWEMLKLLKLEGISILVSTPYMDEAALCDRIALMQHGRILSIDTPGNITRDYPGKLYRVKACDMYRLSKDLENFKYIASCFIFGEYLHVSFIDNSETIRKELIDELHSNGHTNIELDEIEPTIEDCFIKLLKN